MGKLRTFLTRRSLRVDILTAFGGLLLVTVLVVIFYFYRNSTRVVLLLCDALMEQTTQTVINRTEGFLLPVTDMTVMSSQLSAAKVLPFNNVALLERYAIQAIRTYPQVAMFLIGDQKGNFLLSNRQPDGTIATKLVNRTQGPPITTWKYRDKNLQVIRTEINRTDTYDPRLRPWYQGAKQNRGLFVTDLFIFYTGKKPGICVSYPILDSKGRVLGVMGSDIELSGLSTFLKSLRIGKNGVAFIINDKDELVAFPDPSRIVEKQTGDGVLRMIKVEDLEIRSITAAFKQHQTSGAPRVTVDVDGKNIWQLSGTCPLPRASAGKWEWWSRRMTLSARLKKSTRASSSFVWLSWESPRWRWFSFRAASPTPFSCSLVKLTGSEIFNWTDSFN